MEFRSPVSLQFDPVTIYVSSGVNPKRARRRTEEEEEEEEGGMERVPSQEELVGLVGSLWGAGVANPGGQDVQPFIQRYGNGEREREREREMGRN